MRDMGLSRIFAIVVGILTVVLTLAFAPQIETYNGYATSNFTAATNAASMIGATVISPYGGFLIIASLLVTGGLFAWGKGSGSFAEMFATIGVALAAIIVLALFSGSVIGYFDALITATSNAAVKLFYGVLTTLSYISIIGSSGGLKAYKTYRSRKRRKKAAYRPI